MDLIHGDVESAVIAYQTRVCNALNLHMDLQFACVELRVPYHEVMLLLCSTLARYELIPKQIKVMESAKKNDERALQYLGWINRVLAAADRIAGQSSRVFDLIDPTRVPDGVWVSLATLTGHFKADSPAARERLRARLGVPLARLRMKQEISRRAAIGYFSVEMQERFPGGAPYDRLVADLANAVIPGCGVTYSNVQHYRVAYLKLQAFA